RQQKLLAGDPPPGSAVLRVHRTNRPLARLAERPHPPGNLRPAARPESLPRRRTEAGRMTSIPPRRNAHAEEIDDPRFRKCRAATNRSERVWPQGVVREVLSR